MRFYSDSRARFKYAIDTQQKGTARSLFYNGGEGGITQNSLKPVLTLWASPLTRLGAKYSCGRIWSNDRVLVKPPSQHHKKGTARSLFYNGGEGGIRTLDTRLTYTPLAGERLQPLGHFSVLRHSYPSTRAFGRSRGARYSTLRVSPFGSPP